MRNTIRLHDSRPPDIGPILAKGASLVPRPIRPTPPDPTLHQPKELCLGYLSYMVALRLAEVPLAERSAGLASAGPAMALERSGPWPALAPLAPHHGTRHAGD
jgi:hypothetical protein